MVTDLDDTGSAASAIRVESTLKQILPHEVVEEVVNFTIATEISTDSTIATEAVKQDRRGTLMLLMQPSDAPVENRVQKMMERPFDQKSPPKSIQRDRRSTMALLFGDGSVGKGGLL